MSEEPSLFSRVLLSMKLMTETELLELQEIGRQQQQASYQRREVAGKSDDYNITATVALADVITSPLTSEQVKQSLPELNIAELHRVNFALLPYLRCDDVSDGSKTTEWRKDGNSGSTSMSPIHGPVKREALTMEARTKTRDIYLTVQHEFDAGNKAKALMLLDEYIKNEEKADQPTFRLKLHREFMFFHQPGDYNAVIALCEQRLAANEETGHLFGQLYALEIMAFAALRMGQKQRAAAYLDQIETRMSAPSSEVIAQMTAYYGYDSDSKILSLLQDRLKSAKQLRNMLVE